MSHLHALHATSLTKIRVTPEALACKPPAREELEKTTGVAGHRHGHRSRLLLGTFGKMEVAVPRARLFRYMIEAKPENLIGDRAFPLDEQQRRDGIEIIAPHRSNRSKPLTQDGRRFKRYARRRLVERFFAWLQWQGRILVRWEY